MRIHYFFIPLVTIAIIATGGAITVSGLSWYQTLAIPAWAPDGKTIGMIWTTIFVLATASAIIGYNKTSQDVEGRTVVMTAFALNAFLNVFWSYLFFGQHHINAAFVDTILLEVSVLVLIGALSSISRFAAYLLTPYAAWVVIASVINYLILMAN